MTTINDLVVRIFDETTYAKIIPDYELNLLLKITADIILNTNAHFFQNTKQLSVSYRYSDFFLSKSQYESIAKTKFWNMKVRNAFEYANNHLTDFNTITNTAVFSGLIQQLNDFQQSLVKCLATACYNAGIYYIHQIYNWKFTRDLSLVNCEIVNFIKNHDLLKLYQLVYTTVKRNFISPIDFMILCFNSLIEILDQLLNGDNQTNKNQNKEKSNEENKTNEDKIKLTNDDIKTSLDKFEDNVEKFKKEIDDVIEFNFTVYNTQKDSYIKEMSSAITDMEAVKNTFDLIERSDDTNEHGAIFGLVPKLLDFEEHHLVPHRKEEYNYVLKKSKESLINKIRYDYVEIVEMLSTLNNTSRVLLSGIKHRAAANDYFKYSKENDLLNILTKLGKIKKQLKILGEEYYNEINKYKNIESSRYEYIPITSASDLVRVPAYQLAHPKIKEKFVNEQVYGLLPYSERIKKQSLIILLDDSGSMCNYYKLDIVNYIIDNYLKLVKENKCQFIFYLFYNNRYSRLECTKPEHCEEFRMRFNSWMPNKGVTNIARIIQETIDEVSAMETTDKPEILIINDGQDSVEPSKIVFNNVKINSIVVGGLIRFHTNCDLFAVNFKTNEFMSLIKKSDLIRDSEVFNLYEDTKSTKTNDTKPNKTKNSSSNKSKKIVNENIKLIENINMRYPVTLLPKLTKGYLIFI